ncbi:hypothetical protein MNU23_30805 [Pseudomonas aeruginosa]|uniref:hypothetical protein n=1 Tax=Pseudomonas aeruginosa TaxID=287 RepID=UPI0021A3A1DE|nr:hypothetical protein [Pseudomonas aeruginosa]MCT2416069.1 hypothetical protein [Pseudomonas aeruginosa]
MTADVGFAYADGVDDATYPQDALFRRWLLLSAAARLRTSSSKALFALPKDANWLSPSKALPSRRRASSR